MATVLGRGCRRCVREMSEEIELKLGLPPAVAADVCRHPLLQGFQTTQNLCSTYYDTQDLVLYRHGIALRVRAGDGGDLQTVKRAGKVTVGLSERAEWEQPWTGTFGFSDVEDPETRELLQAVAPGLRPVFSTEFRRELGVFTQGETVIRAMVDQGVIRTSTAVEPLCELELELGSGDPSDLYRLALVLSETLPLWPEDRSKAERGYRLLRDGEIAEVIGGPHPIPTRAGAALQQLMAGELRDWQRYVRLAEQDLAQAVHQVRVTQRRLRSLLNLFSPVLGAAFVATWRRRLGDNARRLGAARDLDVLCDQLLPRIIDDKNAGDGPAQWRALEAERRRVRADAGAALAAPVQGRLMLELMTALVAHLPANDDRELQALAARRMSRLRRRLRKRVGVLPSADPVAWHRLRIAAKELRYGLDFLAPLWRAKEVKRYRRHLRRIQKYLGQFQDVEAASQKLATPPAEYLEGAVLQRQLEHYYRKRTRRWRTRALDAARALLRAPAPWRRTRDRKRAKLPCDS